MPRSHLWPILWTHGGDRASAPGLWTHGGQYGSVQGASVSGATTRPVSAETHHAATVNDGCDIWIRNGPSFSSLGRGYLDRDADRQIAEEMDGHLGHADRLDGVAEDNRLAVDLDPFLGFQGLCDLAGTHRSE